MHEALIYQCRQGLTLRVYEVQVHEGFRCTERRELRASSVAAV
jgi:hypothetical protein